MIFILEVKLRMPFGQFEASLSTLLQLVVQFRYNVQPQLVAIEEWVFDSTSVLTSIKTPETIQKGVCCWTWTRYGKLHDISNRTTRDKLDDNVLIRLC